MKKSQNLYKTRRLLFLSLIDFKMKKFHTYIYEHITKLKRVFGFNDLVTRLCLYCYGKNDKKNFKI